MVQFSCASLLIRTKAAIDYCPVMVCEDTGVWSKAGISCGGGMNFQFRIFANNENKLGLLQAPDAWISARSLQRFMPKSSMKYKI